MKQFFESQTHQYYVTGCEHYICNEVRFYYLFIGTLLYSHLQEECVLAPRNNKGSECRSDIQL